MVTRAFLRRHKAGFSLIELLVVVALVVILSGIALPRVGSAIIQSRLRSSSRQLLTDAQNTRQSSISASAANDTEYWRIRFTEGYYQVYKGTPNLSLVPQVAMPAGVKLVAVDPTSFPVEWKFDRMGERTIDITSIVGVQASSGAGSVFNVEVSPAGRVRLWVGP